MTSFICNRRGLFLLAVLAVPTVARAQALSELSLEELMRIDAGRVFGASERNQPVTEAPASVSFITAEEIARYGYRTLADILRGVRGMYVTDDRNFSYLGTRGFAKPGDYNSRILLLVNGHRVNDNVFGQAEIGAEFGMDPAIFERVEIIRGPASSLYGDSAFFAVVNVITRTGASLNGASIGVEGGSLDTARSRASLGRALANGLDFALSGTYERSGGMKRLYFPAFDAPGTNNGVADGLDGEQLGQFFSHVSFKNLTFTGAYGQRRRQVPTASFGTVFNNQTSPEQTTDRHTLLDAEYARSIGATGVVAQVSFDRFSVDGIYPFADEELDSAPVIGRNHVLGARWSVGTLLTRAMPGRQVLTAGAEFIDNVHQDQQAAYDDPELQGFIENRSSTQHAFYAQDEIKIARWLILNAGVRYDEYEDRFRRLTPRAAVIVMPSSSESFKYLFGSAFRAPNAYELNTFYFGAPNLLPESIDTHELVWERYTNNWLRTSVSTYWYKADRLITLTLDPSTFLGVTYVNEGRVRAKGLELEAQMRIRGGVQGLISYALQRVIDPDTHEALINSPRHMLKARVSVRGPTDQSSISVEAARLSSRTTLAGLSLPSRLLTTVTMIQPTGRSFELAGTVSNLFGEQYADPASDQHLQDSIPQNGRTFRIGLRWKFGSK
jgi:iron complex outermembrane receptor protein